MHFLYKGGTYFQALVQIRNIRKLGETEVELADWKPNKMEKEKQWVLTPQGHTQDCIAANVVS